MSVIILKAGRLESILELCGQKVGEYRYDDLDGALTALGNHTIHLRKDPYTVESNDGSCWYVYPDFESAELDEDGSKAWAIVQTVK